MTVGEKIDFLLRKVDCGLDVDAQADQFFRQVIHTQGKSPLQRAQGIARRLCGTGLDQVGDCLGLGQVELVIEKGAFAEFTRPGQAAA
ncbi:hypothetical protein D3C85_1269340 [compost metagenome]